MDQQKKKNQNNSYFFLISFLPALAYWYLEENYPIKIAVMGGMALAVLEILLEKFFTKHVHSLSKFNFSLMLLMGSLSFFGDEGLWFKLTPTISGFFLGSYLLYFTSQNKGLLYETLKTANRPIPPWSIWKTLEYHLSFFMFFYSSLMAFLAIWGTTSQWAFFKSIGIYLLFIPFFIFEVILLKKKISKIHQKRSPHN